MINKMKQLANRRYALMGMGAAALASNSAFAIDTAAVGTALDAAEADGSSVGAMVIGVVASLAVVGVIIALVRKI
jgi:hypothetical protein